MKRLTAILLSALLVLSLAACGNNNQNTGVDTPAGTESPATKPADNENATEPAESETAGTENSDTAETGNGNILIAYFSVMETDGVDTVAGASRVAVNGEVLGNNEYIAQIIQRETGGDLFSIETVQDYPTTHDPLLEFAYNEKADNARPELATQIENLDSYNLRQHFQLKTGDAKALASYHRELYKAYAANKENRQSAEDNGLPEWYEMTERGGLRFLSGILANYLAENVKAFYTASSYFFYENGVYRESEDLAASAKVRERMMPRSVTMQAINDCSTDLGTVRINASAYYPSFIEIIRKLEPTTI